MGEPVKKADHKFTYSEYRLWPEDERWEMIDGIAYNMSPAPSAKHQEISFEIARVIGNFLKNKSCRAFSAPFDVYIPEPPDQDLNEITTIVQPDLSVICNSEKIFDKGCMGAPDLIVEILSPSTSARDLNEKFHLYEKSGVKEYWVIDPGNEYVRIFQLIEGKYDYGFLIPSDDIADKNIIAASIVFPGFQINIKQLFS